jgi:hypothetical protein
MARRRGRIRSRIYQAGWNYRSWDLFPKVALGMSVLVGFSMGSWWAFLICFFLLTQLPHRAVGVFSSAWGAIFAFIGGAALLPLGVGAAVTGALVGFASSWVPMRSSEQYWRDLEADGGPYSD